MNIKNYKIWIIGSFYKGLLAIFKSIPLNYSTPCTSHYDDSYQLSLVSFSHQTVTTL